MVQLQSLFKDGHSLAPFTLDPEQHDEADGYLDHHAAALLLQRLDDERARSSDSKASLRCSFSLDLGGSERDVLLTDDGLHATTAAATEGEKEPLLASIKELGDIASKAGVYALFADGSKPWRVACMSATTGNAASLCPPLEGTGPPTMLLGGFTMHRIKGANPQRDTANKMSALPVFPGSTVLDTCTGLGYTAIAAARRCDSGTGSGGGGGHCVTCELDEASLQMCAHNPHSDSLFDGSLPLSLLHGSVDELVQSFETGAFSSVLHDPPARALCKTNLYGIAFYRQLHRVLKYNGKLFHYIGNADSNESGRLYRGIAERLQQAGFVDIRTDKQAFGITAVAGPAPVVTMGQL